MQLIKVVIISGICVMLAGCTPISSVKGLLSLLLPVIAALGATTGWFYDRCEDRVIKKVEELDTLVANHQCNCDKEN
jgi:hypothetical protein